MAKTTFINGLTVMTAEWCNKAYVTDGGHKHDGVNADGHAQKINLNTEFTVGAQGKLEAPTESSELHVIRHDHAASGSAILQTDVLRLHGAPRDATRRAQAPLDQSLYLQNTPKMLLGRKYDVIGNFDVTTASYNISGDWMANPDDSYSYVVNALDGSNVLGVVISTFEGETIPPYIVPLTRVFSRWDAVGDRVVVTPYIFDGGVYKRLRDQAPSFGDALLYYLNIVVW